MTAIKLVLFCVCIVVVVTATDVTSCSEKCHDSSEMCIFSVNLCNTKNRLEKLELRVTALEKQAKANNQEKMQNVESDQTLNEENRNENIEEKPKVIKTPTNEKSSEDDSKSKSSEENSKPAEHSIGEKLKKPQIKNSDVNSVPAEAKTSIETEAIKTLNKDYQDSTAEVDTTSKAVPISQDPLPKVTQTSGVDDVTSSKTEPITQSIKATKHDISTAEEKSSKVVIEKTTAGDKEIKQGPKNEPLAPELKIDEEFSHTVAVKQRKPEMTSHTESTTKALEPSTAATKATTASRCDDGFRFHGNHCYQISSVEMTHYEAEAHCSKQNAKLLSIESELENVALAKILNVEHGYWTAGIMQNGTWIWGNDEAIDGYTNWIGKTGIERPPESACLGLASGEEHKWMAVACTKQLRAICIAMD